MPLWQTCLTLGSGAETKKPESLSVTLPIRRGIFQGDSLSPLIFCLCLNPISSELKRSGMGYVISVPPEEPLTLSHLWYMDDLKLYARNKQQSLSMVRTVHVMAESMGLLFGTEKCAHSTIVRGRLNESADLQIYPGLSLRSLGPSDSYNYLGLLELHDTLHENVKTSVMAEYARRIQALIDSHLCARDLPGTRNQHLCCTSSYVQSGGLEVEASSATWTPLCATPYQEMACSIQGHLWSASTLAAN